MLSLPEGIGSPAKEDSKPSAAIAPGSSVHARTTCSGVAGTDGDVAASAAAMASSASGGGAGVVSDADNRPGGAIDPTFRPGTSSGDKGAAVAKGVVQRMHAVALGDGSSSPADGSSPAGVGSPADKSSDVAEGTRGQLGRAIPQLLEVNSSPDFGLVAKQFPGFLDDAFTALFLPHERLPASFIAV